MLRVVVKNNRKKYRFLLVFAFLFCGCEIDYEDGERLLILGTAGDASFEPFPELPIDATAYDSGFLRGSGRIGISTTATDGTYSITTLSPKGSANIAVEINNPLHQDYNPNYSSYDIRGVNELPLKNSTYSVPDISISKLVNVTLQINRVMNMADSLIYTYGYKSPMQTLSFQQGTQPGSSAPFLDGRSGVMTSGESIQNISIPDLSEGDTLRLTYQLRNNSIPEYGETRLIFDDEQDAYVFEF